MLPNSESSIIFENLLSILREEGFVAPLEPTPDKVVATLIGQEPICCPSCASPSGVMKHGTANSGAERRYCKNCKSKTGKSKLTFVVHYGTLLFYVHYPEKLLTFLWLMLTKGAISVEEMARLLGISKATAFNYRHRIGIALSQYPGFLTAVGLGEYALVAVPHMEKGGSDRGLSTNKSEVCAPEVHIYETFTQLLLQDASKGKILVSLLEYKLGEAKNLQGFKTAQLYVDNLLSHFESTYRCVSSRYLLTYVYKHMVETGVFNVLDIFLWVLRNRNACNSFWKTRDQDIWNQPTVMWGAKAV